jgi:hypothetical protein
MAAITRHHTQWAAQFYAAAELSRRGYLVSLTLGHAPATDLLAKSPRGAPLYVEVKGQQGKSDWFIRRPEGDDTVYLLVAVPTRELAKPGIPRFFIMSPSEIRAAMDAYLKDRRARGTTDAKWQSAVRWRDAECHEDRWDKLDPRGPKGK